jgi:predicted transcriptional regulator
LSASKLGKTQICEFTFHTKCSTHKKESISETLLEQTADDDGYRHVTISDSVIAVHLLVARAFIGRLPGIDVIVHKDGDLSNNHAENLVLRPVSVVLGIDRVQTSIGRERVRSEKYRRVIDLKVEGHDEDRIAKLTGIKPCAVKKVIAGSRGHSSFGLSEQFCETVRGLSEKNMSDAEIAEFLGIGAKVVGRVHSQRSRTVDVDNDTVKLVDDVMEFNIDNDKEFSFVKVPKHTLRKLSIFARNSAMNVVKYPQKRIIPAELVALLGIVE